MIITYKIKHYADFTRELVIAHKVAEFAIENRDKLSTKYVSYLGLKAVISNQILRKYGRNTKTKNVQSVKLAVPGCKVRYKDGTITISSMNLHLPFDKTCQKINQIEFDQTFAYVSVTVEEQPQYTPLTSMGVDLNTTGHCAVAAIKETGKVYKLGKQAHHIHTKYKEIRRKLQKGGHYAVVKKIKNREQRIVRDINHKVSRSIVNIAKANQAHLHLEDLKGIRKTTKSRKSFRYALHSWSFYQLGQFIGYKALLAGVPISFDEPAYTSKCCSRCGLIGNRNGKQFTCSCGHVEHADVNAAFNLAFASPSIVQLQSEKRRLQGQSGTPQTATHRSNATVKLLYTQ